MADVFVSYKKQERAFAERVVASLQAAGYTVWWDDDLSPRASWDAEIEREISAAKAVLVLWSEMSASEESFVRREAGYAQDHGKLVPARIDRCALPLRFRDVQTADLTRWDGTDSADREWGRVLAWIGALAGRTPKQAAPRTIPVAPAHSSVHAYSSPAGTRWATLAFLFLAALMIQAGRFSFYQSAISIQQEFGLSNSQLGMLSAISTIAAVLGAVASGAFMGQRPARLALVTAGLVIACFGGLASAFASSFVQLLAARAIAGLGQGLFAPAAIILAAYSVPSRWRAVSIGLLGAAMGFAAVVSSVWQVSIPAWQASPYVFSGGGLILAIVCGPFLKNPEAQRPEGPLAERSSSFGLFWIACGLHLIAVTAMPWILPNVARTTGESTPALILSLSSAPAMLGVVLVLSAGVIASLGNGSSARHAVVLSVITLMTAASLALVTVAQGTGLKLAAFLFAAIVVSWFGVGYAGVLKQARHSVWPVATLVIAGYITSLVVPGLSGHLFDVTVISTAPFVPGIAAALLATMLLLVAFRRAAPER